MPDDRDDSTGGRADVLALLERAAVVARRRRRLRLGLALVGLPLLSALVVVVVLLAGG